MLNQEIISHSRIDVTGFLFSNFSACSAQSVRVYTQVGHLLQSVKEWETGDSGLYVGLGILPKLKWYRQTVLEL